MDLRHLTDETLLKDTKYLVSRERELTTKILNHLREIDKRKLYSDLGYSSLFDYCIKDLGYSESSTHRRIQSARLLDSLPGLEKKLELGILNMSNLAQAAQFFKANEINNPTERKIIIKKLEGLTKKEGEKKLFTISGLEIKTRDKSKRISENKISHTIILSDEINSKLEKIRDLMNHNGSMAEFIDKLLDLAMPAFEKKKFSLHTKQKTLISPVKVQRRISASVKKEVYLRDQKCIKCGTTHRLQFDHQMPFALGGDSSVKNVRMLCFNCNQRARIRAKL
jgi:hypothetical protein